jgi:hypothetical protein
LVVVVVAVDTPKVSYVILTLPLPEILVLVLVLVWSPGVVWIWLEGGEELLDPSSLRHIPLAGGNLIGMRSPFRAAVNRAKADNGGGRGAQH